MERAHRMVMAGAVILTILLTPGLVSFTNREPEKPPPRKASNLQHPAALTEPPLTGTANVRLLGVNDFHGNLEAPATTGEPTGGAAYLAAYLDRYDEQSPDGTIRVHAGDMVGGSPLISGYFHDEPTIEAMNADSVSCGTGNDTAIVDAADAGSENFEDFVRLSSCGNVLVR